MPTQRAYTFYGTACLALRSGDGYIASKKFLKKSYGGIAFQHEIGDVVIMALVPLRVRSVPS